MKLSSLFNFVTLTLLGATAAHAAGSNHRVSTGEGLMECGRFYYEATLTPVESSLLNGPQAEVSFKNTQAQAACGGEIVNTNDVSDVRGNVLFGNYKMPRFMTAKKVESARASLLDNRSLRVGGNYKIACGKEFFAARVLDVHEAGYSLVSFKFADAAAEAACGQGRYHQIRHVLHNNYKVSWAELGF